MAENKARIYDAAVLFEQRKCPPGSRAQHPEWGLVTVWGAAGSTRQVERVVDRPDSIPETVIETVEVRELRQVRWDEFGVVPRS